MTAETILRDMAGRGILLIPNGDLLDIEAPDDLLTDDVVQTLRDHKPELLALLTAPGRCLSCHEPANLSDRALDAWYCPNCRTWADSQGKPLPSHDRVRPITREDHVAAKLLDDLRAAGCGFRLGGEDGRELTLTHPARVSSALWARFEASGPEFRELARAEAERQAEAWEGEEASQWVN